MKYILKQQNELRNIYICDLGFYNQVLKRRGVLLKDKSSKASENERYWFVRTVDEALDETGSSAQGLSDSEAEKRLKEYGLNTIAKEEGFKWWKSLLEKFNSLIIYVLFVAAIISLVFNEIVEFIVIIVIILITALMGFFQEYSANKSMQALSKLTAKKVEVVRNGKRREIPAEELVVGDIVLLRRGMIVPADLRIVECSNLSVDEAILTGESVQKHKIIGQIEHKDLPLSDRDNMCFGGTSVTGGSGKGLVVETGLNSEIGKISLALKKIGKTKSPLQKKIDVMGTRISYMVIAVCVFFFVVLQLKQFELYESLILVAAVMVGGIPEGFPLTLTLALSNGVRRMAKSNAIVKDLSSVETLGTTTVICTDKTGTLTENKMRVKKFSLSLDKEFSVDGHGYDPESIFTSNHKVVSKEYFKNQASFFEACVLCNNADVYLEDGDWVLKGEPTEGALLTLAKSAGYDEVVLREDYKRIYEIPFDPAHKFMVTVNRVKKAGKEKEKAYLKGALEKVLEKCTDIRANNGRLVKLTDKEKKKILESTHKYSSEALRVLGVATKNLNGRVHVNDNGHLSKKDLDRISKQYTFEGIVGIQDPIRKDVFQAVKECHSAGVDVKIVTGDHKVTAHAIGEQLGLLKPGHDRITLGVELDNMDDEELDAIIKEVAIFARTTPDHKLRIVSSLQRLGEIVAMTGDGVNDAPALKKADIGVSMGKGGTEVARESSNLVLADDNFSTIVNAIREGRTIYSNIRRFIYYFLTINFTEVTLVVFTVLIGLFSPLTAIMILFINVITSVVPSLALAVEPTHMKVMKQKPRNPKEHLLSKYILSKIFVMVPILFLGTFLLYLWELNVAGATLEKARTVAFATIIMFELFHALNAKSLHVTLFNKNFFSNNYLFLAILTSFTLMLMTIYTRFGNEIFQTVPLYLADWVIIILVSSSAIIVSEIVKMLIDAEFKEQSNLQGIKIKLQ